jgi:hypothetical protein
LGLIDDEGTPMYITPGGYITYKDKSTEPVVTLPPSEESLRMYDEHMSLNIEHDDGLNAEWDKADQMSVKKQLLISKEGFDTLYRVMKLHKIPTEYHDIYRNWLLYQQPAHSSWSEEMLPIGRTKKLELGLEFPYPTGTDWRAAMRMADENTS